MDSNEMALMLEFNKKLNELVELGIQRALKSQARETFQSESVNELAASMAKAQGEYMPLLFNKTNPYERWEYNDLNSILDAARPALTKYGIFFTQLPCVDESGATIVYTRLIHSSGQWIECRSRVIPSLNNQHEFDSVLMFQRRAAACSILGLAGANDRTDDDAEKDMHVLRTKEDKGVDINYAYDNSGASYERITKEQLEELEYIIADSGFNDLVRQLISRERIETLADLPKSRYFDTLKRTNEIIVLRKGVKK
jgi:hypothetical protein